MLMRAHFIYLLLALLAFTACSEDYEESPTVQINEKGFEPNVSFLRLQDDSTDVAGILNIATNSKHIELRWVVSSECNLDTTVTLENLANGKYRLPIKWIKKSNEGTYGPAYTAFCAGVRILDGEQNKYVPLIWADEVDTVKVMKYIEGMQVKTRAGETEEYAVNEITICAEMPIQLDKDTCGVIPFSFPPTLGTCMTDYTDFEYINGQEGYGMDLSGIELYYFDAEPAVNIIPLKWGDTGAPTNKNVMGHIRISSMSGFDKYAYFQYNVPKEKVWEYIETKPDTLSTLPATRASVIAIANTNYPWSLQFKNEDGTIDTVRSVKSAEGEQSLIMRIPDNKDLAIKNVIIDVFSEDTLKLHLKFTQSAASGSFAIDSVVPAITEKLDGMGEKVYVHVTTSRNWWIEYNGDRHPFTTDDKVGFIDIPQNPAYQNRDIVINVGYENTVVGTYRYTQAFASELKYMGCSMPDSIPVQGNTYAFHFGGAYQGSLQLQALVDNEVIVVGASSLSKDLTLVIPSNSLNLNTRTVKIQYKKGDENWQDLGEERGQKAAEIIPSILPTTDIPREGATYAGMFSGSYTGTVFMEVRDKDGNVVDNGQSQVPGTVNVVIGVWTGTDDRKLSFYYKAGTQDWKLMGERTQVTGTVNVGIITPPGNIPSGGKPYNCMFTGTYPDDITFRAADKDGNTIASQTGRMPLTFTINIPANESKDTREVYFQYRKKNGVWINIESMPRMQTSDIKINGGGNTVGGYGEEDKIEGGAEL